MEINNLRDYKIINNSLFFFNKPSNFFRPDNTSCIDHIISNHPSKLSCITTYNDYNKDQNDQSIKMMIR